MQNVFGIGMTVDYKINNPQDFIDPDEGREIPQPFFTHAQPCQSCGKPCDSLTRCSWDSDLMVGPCCQISSEDLAEIRPCCETLYHLVCQAQTVQAVCEAFDSHEKSGCPICQGARKTIAGQVETKQERRAA